MLKGKEDELRASVSPGLGEDAAEVILHDLFSCPDALRYDHIREAGTDQNDYATFLGRQSPQERSSLRGYQSIGHGNNDIKLETVKVDYGA